MNKIYIAIDIGCHECGVDSEVIGYSYDEEEAQSMADKRSEETKNWREGGQSIPLVFELKL